MKSCQESATTTKRTGLVHYTRRSHASFASGSRALGARAVSKGLDLKGENESEKKGERMT